MSKKPESVRPVRKPVNVVMTHADPTLSAEQLGAAGVKRISVGGTLSRFALAAFLKGAREMKDAGTFTFVPGAAPSKELKAAFARGR